MAGRARRIALQDIPGAEENQVRWMMCSGVLTRKGAKKAAAAFISDLKQVRAQAKVASAKGKK